MTEDQKVIPEEKNAQLEPLLEARNITKRFPGVLALNRCFSQVYARRSARSSRRKRRRKIDIDENYGWRVYC